MIVATVIVKFSDNKIKRYHKSCYNKKAAKLALEVMKRIVIEYQKHLNMLGLIWDGKNRPWREE